MIRRVLDDPLTWAAAVLLVALWCMGQALAGEPGLPVDSLPPARYVVEAPFEREAGRAPAPGDVAVPGQPSAHVVAGATVSQVPQDLLVAHPPAPLEQVAPATLVVEGAP